VGASPVSGRNVVYEQAYAKGPPNSWLMLAMIVILPVFELSQHAQLKSTLIVNGRWGLAIVVQIEGRSYSELESLARVVSGFARF
jgi:hypothetical protein